MPDDNLSILERLQAYANKVDDPVRLAQFRTFGAERYADAEFLNLLREALVDIYQNGGGGNAVGGTIDQDNIFITKTVGIQAGYTAELLAIAINNASQFTVTEKQLVLFFVNVTGTPNSQFDMWVLVNKGKGTYGFNSGNALQAVDLKRIGKTLFATTDVIGLEDALGAKADLVAGKVPTSQLPSYVDDVIEAVNFGAFPVTGEGGKLYVALDSNLVYRWSGSTYVNISSLDTNRNFSIEFQQLSPNAYISYDLKVALTTPLLVRNITAVTEYQLIRPGSTGTTRTTVSAINADIAALSTTQAAAGYSVRVKATVLPGESFGTAIIKATVL